MDRNIQTQAQPIQQAQINENLRYSPFCYYFVATISLLILMATIWNITNDFYFMYLIMIFISFSISIIIGILRSNAIRYNTRRENQAFLESILIIIGLLLILIIYIIKYTILGKKDLDFIGVIVFTIGTFIYCFPEIILLYLKLQRRNIQQPNIQLVPPIMIYIEQQPVVEQNEYQIKNEGLNEYIAKQLIEKYILDNKLCPITQEQIVITNSGVLECGHVFTGDKLREYLSKNKECPVCKKIGLPTYFT